MLGTRAPGPRRVHRPPRRPERRLRPSEGIAARRTARSLAPRDEPISVRDARYTPLQRSGAFHDPSYGDHPGRRRHRRPPRRLPAAASGGGSAEFEVEGWKVHGTVVKVGDIVVKDFKAGGFEAEAEFTRR
ncbi:hypothetical protein OIM90_28970 [Streptomyces sp. AD16]|nr:hypothetical protein NQP46_03655 [Streptomyces albus]WDV33830.1 hypothetical protein OIM90_28970 [Streptomyces sp. AD16]